LEGTSIRAKFSLIAPARTLSKSLNLKIRVH
jgi:hypothetical protein